MRCNRDACSPARGQVLTTQGNHYMNAAPEAFAHPYLVTLIRDTQFDCSAWVISKGFETLASGVANNHAAAAHGAAGTMTGIADKDDRVFGTTPEVIEAIVIAGFENVGTLQETHLLHSSNRALSLQHAQGLTNYHSKLQARLAPAVVEHFESTVNNARSKKSQLPRLSVATDASLGNWGGKIAGIAWIAADGRSNAKCIEVYGRVDIAELWAIHLAITAFHRDQKLLIQTDSKNSVHLINNRSVYLTNHASNDPHTVEAIEAIDRALENRDIDIAWVRAHSGHPLNETSDKIAKTVRRHHEMKDETPERWEEIDAIILKGIGFNRKTRQFMYDAAGDLS